MKLVAGLSWLLGRRLSGIAILEAIDAPISRVLLEVDGEFTYEIYCREPISGTAKPDEIDLVAAVERRLSDRVVAMRTIDLNAFPFGPQLPLFGTE